MSFRKYLEELNESNKDIENCAKEVHQNLFNNSIGKTTAMDNFWKEVLKDHNLKDSDKKAVIAIVKKKHGYTGNLLNEAEEKVSPKEKEYLAGVMMGHKAKGKYKGQSDEAIMAMLIDAYLEDKTKFNFKG